MRRRRSWARGMRSTRRRRRRRGMSEALNPQP
jgi:hypothetical protein